MPFSTLLASTGVTPAGGDPVIRGLACDSRKVVPGDCFFAVPGHATDGSRFIDDAVARGAVAVVANHAVTNVPCAEVPHVGAALGRMACAFLGDPQRALTTVGITGTNGKTTCAWLLGQALSGPMAVLGTLGFRLAGRLIPGQLTTPDGLGVAQHLAAARDGGARGLVMEVSSHALEQRRVAGLTFDVALFTNLSRDHLDYHGTEAAYFAAKRRLFEDTAGARVVNIDDPHGRRLAEDFPCITVSAAGADAVVSARDVRVGAHGITATFSVAEHRVSVQAPLLGRFNVDNIAAVLGVAHALGDDLEAVVSRLTAASGVPGRMEPVRTGAVEPLVIVDYAHTPDALSQALTAARALTSGKLICVFGCGGDRDQGKRAPMGAAAASADRVWITSDNPRSEDPHAIMAMAASGVPDGAAVCEGDRRLAIFRAVAEAKPGDVVLVAGKGHETTQTDATGAHPFDDRAVAHEALEARHDV